MKKITLAIIAFLMVLTINAQSVNIGTTSYNTITEAITAANEGDVILITGVHTEAISFGKSITLRGTDPTTDIIQEATSASGDGSGLGVINVIRAEETDILNVTIENLGIRNGNSVQNGGGINADKVKGLLTLNNLIVENNYSAKNGGGLTIAGSNAEIINCTIKNNTSSLDGGGILLAPNNGAEINSEINISKSLIDSNNGRNGGGIYINGNNQFGNNYKIDVNLENSTISNNTTTSPAGGNGGGAIFTTSFNLIGSNPLVGNATLQIVHATVYNNSHAAPAKSGLQFAGNNVTNFSAYNSIIVNADDPTIRGINFANTNTTNVVNCILGGLDNAAPFLTIIDDEAKNNLKGRTATQAGLTGVLTDEGGSTQVLAITDASNPVDFCSASTGITLPTIDQRGATRTGIADAGAFELGGTLSTSNYEFAASLRLYPNPAKTIVTISGIENIEAIEVYSVLGKLVKKVTNQNMLNVQNLSKGIYLMSIKKENNTVTKKLIIE
jgi:hypothetical protein